MRIIAGEFRGRKLKAVPGLTTRPTADRVKEAVFSAIEPYLQDCCFLDLFSGTGNLALEAVSRGARAAVLVECDKGALAVIRANVTACGAEARCRLLERDALVALDALAREKACFDVIYLDPPYQAGLYEKVLSKIAQQALLTKNGVLILESAKNTSILVENSLFCIYKTRCYGDTKISFLRNQDQILVSSAKR